MNNKKLNKNVRITIALIIVITSIIGIYSTWTWAVSDNIKVSNNIFSKYL